QLQAVARASLEDDDAAAIGLHGIAAARKGDLSKGSCLAKIHHVFHRAADVARPISRETPDARDVVTAGVQATHRISVLALQAAHGEATSRSGRRNGRATAASAGGEDRGARQSCKPEEALHSTPPCDLLSPLFFGAK